MCLKLFNSTLSGSEGFFFNYNNNKKGIEVSPNS